MENRVENCLVYSEGTLYGPASVLCDFPISRTDASFLFGNSGDTYGIFPGFCDVHVHFREPGFSYKETIFSGSRAAAHGGYTDVCTMPNLSPVPDCPASLLVQQRLIEKNALVGVHPYAALTVGEKGERCSDISSLGALCVAFSDDGKGVQSESMMRQAMEAVAKTGRILAAHCEDESLLKGGYIHAGRYAASHGHRGIVSESEWGPLARDLRLAKETGCPYHVCHVSSKESVRLIRQAKKEGVNVTSETAPHYLVLTEDDLEEDGRFKMNPPLRSEADRAALLEGIADGTIDMIATDHAPHSAEEKTKGLAGSLMGVTGLECAFPILYTHLVRKQGFPLQKLLALMTDNPRRRFGLPRAEGSTVWNLSKKTTVSPEAFLSQGKATPFAGQRVYAECLLTIYKGETVWKAEK